MQVALTVFIESALLYVACGVAVLISTGPRVRGLVDTASRFNIKKYGRLPSFQAEVIYFALAILSWPVVFARMCR